MYCQFFLITSLPENFQFFQLLQRVDDLDLTASTNLQSYVFRLHHQSGLFRRKNWCDWKKRRRTRGKIARLCGIVNFWYILEHFNHRTANCPLLSIQFSTFRFLLQMRFPKDDARDIFDFKFIMKPFFLSTYALFPFVVGQFWFIWKYSSFF